MNKLKLFAMHFILACSVIIGDLDASPFVDQVEVRSGWKELTDEATITMPKKLVSLGLAEITPGQTVSITVGYEGYQREVFTGYVKQVNPKIPLEIICEDASWLLKQTNINRSWTTSVTLHQILNHVIDKTNLANPDTENIRLSTDGLPEITFSSFRIPNKNAAQVLQTFKENPYNLAIYFRGNELKTHIAYTDVSLGTVEYFLDQNVISSKLEYREPGQHRVQVKAIVMNPDNTYEKQTYGQSGGDTIKLTFSKGESPELVEALTKGQLQRFSEGYRGSLQTFMIPFATHGMSARVVDPEWERDSRYHIDATRLRFGDGITIDVDLGIKLS